VWDDVRNGLVLDGQCDVFARSDRVDQLSGQVAQIPSADLHVRQCCTSSNRIVDELSPRLLRKLRVFETRRRSGRASRGQLR